MQISMASEPPTVTITSVLGSYTREKRRSRYRQISRRRSAGRCCGIKGLAPLQRGDARLADGPGGLEVRLAHPPGDGVLQAARIIKKFADAGRLQLLRPAWRGPSRNRSQKPDLPLVLLALHEQDALFLVFIEDKVGRGGLHRIQHRQPLGHEHGDIPEGLADDGGRRCHSRRS